MNKVEDGGIRDKVEDVDVDVVFKDDELLDKEMEVENDIDSENNSISEIRSFDDKGNDNDEGLLENEVEVDL